MKEPAMIQKNPRILIAAFAPQSKNYVRLAEQSGFTAYDLGAQEDRTALSFAALLHADYDLLLLPGGGDIDPQLYHQSCRESHAPDPVLDLTQFLLLSHAVARHAPVLGICKGMQLINVYFGGTLHQHLPNAALHSNPSCDVFHDVFLTEDTRFSAICSILSAYPSVNSAHHQGIDLPGRELACIEYAPDGTPEAIVHTDLPVLGLQWHPERMQNTTTLFRALIHYLLCTAA
jgi:putative glutamine amidotransferase